MSPLAFVLLSGTLTFGVPLALAVYELLHLAPDPRRGDDEPPPEPRLAPAPLPGCLQPRTLRAPLRIARPRVLDRV